MPKLHVEILSLNNTDLIKRFEDSLDSLLELNTRVNYTIYIPSKGRAGKSVTAKMLSVDNVPFKLVVEPQDAKDYIAVYGAESVLVMDQNDQGIAYARNWCKNHSESFGEAYHWQIDDNIYYLGVRRNNKNHKLSPNSCLSAVEQFIEPFSNIGGCSLTHIMFAFAKKRSLDVNKQIYTCSLFRNFTGCHWRPDCIEDTDYSLQLLSADYVTLLFNRIIMNKAATGVFKGGNTEISHGGNRRYLRSVRLSEYWPGAFRVTEQYGRVKIAPSRIWLSFKQEALLHGEQKTDLSSFYG